MAISPSHLGYHMGVGVGAGPNSHADDSAVAAVVWDRTGFPPLCMAVRQNEHLFWRFPIK